MTTFRPAILRFNRSANRWEAYNQDGRLILHRRSRADAASSIEHYEYDLCTAEVLPSWHAALKERLPAVKF